MRAVLLLQRRDRVAHVQAALLGGLHKASKSARLGESHEEPRVEDGRGGVHQEEPEAAPQRGVVHGAGRPGEVQESHEQHDDHGVAEPTGSLVLNPDGLQIPEHAVRHEGWPEHHGQEGEDLHRRTDARVEGDHHRRARKSVIVERGDKPQIRATRVHVHVLLDRAIGRRGHLLRHLRATVHVVQPRQLEARLHQRPCYAEVIERHHDGEDYPLKANDEAHDRRPIDWLFGLAARQRLATCCIRLPVRVHGRRRHDASADGGG
mmetsp:Transcript_25886/g.65882  ORF Transcript_25886/g.65882 Transcript_25886/m.65882 type:complete len:263 (+) Transcript_25886:1098-1886(+)